MDNNVMFKAEIDVPIERISDAIISAVNGGVYGCSWAYALRDDSRRPTGLDLSRMQQYLRSMDHAETWYGHWVLFGGILAIQEHFEEKEPAVTHLLTRINIRNGLRTMALKHNRFGDIFDEGKVDAELGDFLLQFCIFGEVKY